MRRKREREEKRNLRHKFMLAHKSSPFYYVDVVLKYKSTVPQMSFVTRLRTFLLGLEG